MTTAAVAPATTFREAPITSFVPWSGNPRKHWNRSADQELVENIRQNGVIEPLIARLDAADALEIIAGERRYRAALTAGLATLPVVVRELTDAQALKFALSENKHRNDLHPLDEAEAFAELQRLDAAATVEAIAAEQGWTPRHIRDRLLLRNLTPSVKTAFEAGQITVTHAQKIGRLEQAVQAKAFEACFSQEFDYDSGTAQDVLQPVSTLTAWINSHVRLDLGSLEAQEDFPELAAEVTAAAAAGATVLMLSESYAAPSRGRKPQPGDPLLHNRWEECSKRDRRAVLGVIVEGRRRGKQVHVALTEDPAPTPRTPTSSSTPGPKSAPSGGTTATRATSERERVAEQKRVAEQQATAARAVAVLTRAAITAARAMERPGAFRSKGLLTLIAEGLRGAGAFEPPVLEAVTAALKLPSAVFAYGQAGSKAMGTLTPKQLAAVIVVQAVGCQLNPPSAFKAIGIDLKKVDAAVLKEQKATALKAERAAQPAPTKATKKTGKKGRA